MADKEEKAKGPTTQASASGASSAPVKKQTLAERRKVVEQRKIDAESTGRDLDFKIWQEENKVEIEAFIQRSSRDWYPDLYIFRFRKGKEDWSAAKFVPWNETTFEEIKKSIGGSK